MVRDTMSYRDACRKIAPWVTRCCLLWVASFCVLITAAEASPLDAKDIADVQCVIIGARLSGSPNQSRSQSGEMLMLYFLGRLDGRSPNMDLQTLIEREAKKMTSSDFKHAAQRCGAEFSARGAEIVRIGNSIAVLGG